MTRSIDQSVLFHVQHLLGIGHVRRANIVCQALSRAGFQVILATGGRPIADLQRDGIEIVQLPPLHIGESGFHDLRDNTNTPVNADWKLRRRDRLLNLFDAVAPDILITEAFPFGRRQMRFELIPLLKHAAAHNQSPQIYCSVRDILKSDRKPGRAEETVALIDRFYDGVLVHGDPAFAALVETFPDAAQFDEKVHHTGIVAAPPVESLQSCGDEILVSAGGGAVGLRLFETAIAARALSSFAKATWRILVGPNIAEEDFRRLCDQAADGVLVEHYRTDFRALLTNCRVSISQAGYNTVADLILAETPAVLVPFDTNGEDEQPRRAAKLAERGYAVSLPSQTLTSETLAAAVDEASRLKRAKAGSIRLDGAARTASILQSAHAQ
ncbi:MAG: glycosyltransferase [Pseudomonadota bacterium]|nr:glycosyltransferase [Pseudomonadota bacterium]